MTLTYLIDLLGSTVISFELVSTNTYTLRTDRTTRTRHIG